MFVIAEVDPSTLDQIIGKFEESSPKMTLTIVEDIRDFCGCNKDNNVRKITTHHFRSSTTYNNGSSCEQDYSDPGVSTQTHASQLLFCGDVKMEPEESTSAIPSPILIEDDNASSVSGSEPLQVPPVVKLDRKCKRKASSQPINDDNASSGSETAPVTLARKRKRKATDADEPVKTTAEMLESIQKYQRGHHHAVTQICRVCDKQIDLGRRPAVHGAIKLEHAKTHMENDEGGPISDQNVDLILLAERCFPYQTKTTDKRKVTRRQLPQLEEIKKSSTPPSRNTIVVNNVLQMLCERCEKHIPMGEPTSLNRICDRVVAHAKKHLGVTFGDMEVSAMIPALIDSCFPHIQMADETAETEPGTSNNMLKSLVEQAIQNMS